MEIKIGELVQTTMKRLFNDEKITQEEIEKMTQKEYSKQVFDADIPVLKEVPKGGNIKELIMINGLKEGVKSRPRYYAYTISIYGKCYLLSNHWFASQRSYYEKWLSTISNRKLKGST